MLYELMSGIKTLSVIGMCKNAGKTTVLNSLIRECEEHGEVIGLTSIGRDGERSDLVTNTAKPEIFVREGAVVATAERLLRECAVSREILFSTGIPTPMGEIIVFRARSSGCVQIGGASITEHQRAVRDLLVSFGCTRVFIDGAISRRSLGDPSLCDGVVLSSGASYDADIRTTVADTAYIAGLYALPVLPYGELTSRYTAVSSEGVTTGEDVRSVMPALKSGADMLCLKGALTDAAAKELTSCGKLLSGTLLVAEDASRLLLSLPSYEKLKLLTRGFAVQRGTRLIAVTVNPFSAYGMHYEKNEFKERVAAALERANVRVPVMDVKNV